MSMYRIDGEVVSEARLYTPGNLLSAEVYTESIPSGLTLEKFSTRLVGFSPNRVKGYVAAGLIEFQKESLLFYNTDPEVALRQIEELGRIIRDLQVDADPKDNVLKNIQRVEIPQEHIKRQRGLKLLLPYKRAHATTVTLRVH